MDSNISRSSRRYLEALLLVGGAVLIIFTVWYVYHVDNLASQQTNAAATRSSPMPPTAKPGGRAKDGILVITEWGVKLPATGILAQANYRFGAGSKKTVFLSTTHEDSVTECHAQLIHERATPTDEALTRYELTDLADSVPGYLDGTITAAVAATKVPQSFIQIGNYVYGYSVGNGINCDRSSGIRAAFSAAVAGLTTVN